MKRDESRSIWDLLSEYFREVAVLIAVFGFLDKITRKDDNVGVEYALAVVGLSFLFFLLGFWFELKRDGE